jgi:chemotaxis protein histidine kinase CheA
MAENVEVEITVTNNIAGSISQLKALKAQLKNTAAGTEEFKKLYNEIDDLEDKIKSAKGVSADWIDSLEMAGGPLGMLGGALNKAKVATQSWGAALKATGIGLVVAAIGGLVAAFSESESSMKKLEPLFIGLEKIMGGILEAAQPMIDMFIELAIQALPYVTKAVGIFYSAIAGLFTYIKTMATGVAKVWKGILTFDFDTIVDGVKTMGSSFGKTADSYNDSMDRFEAGTKKVTKTQKKNATDAADAAEKARQAALKEIETRYKLLNANLEADKAELLSKAKTEDERAKIELEYAKKTNNLKNKELSEKQDLYKKETDEYKGFQAEKITADTEYLNKQTEFKNSEAEKAKEHNKALLEAENKYKQELIELNAKTETEKLDNWLLQQTKEIDLLAKTEEEKQKLLIALDANYQAKLNIINEKKKQDKLAAEAQADLDLSANQKLSFDERYKSIADREALISNITFDNEKAKTEFERQNSDARKAIAEEEKNAKIKSLASYADSLGQISNLLGESTTAGKAAAIASTTISTYLAAQQAYASQLTPGDPTSPFRAALAAGVAVASGLANVQKILSVDTPGGGGGGATPTAPTYNAPSFNVVGTSGVNQIAQTIGQQSQAPIKAYVVSSDVTTQQALDRNIVKSATLG